MNSSGEEAPSSVKPTQRADEDRWQRMQMANASFVLRFPFALLCQTTMMKARSSMGRNFIESVGHFHALLFGSAAACLC